jgi:hypothetical protein
MEMLIFLREPSPESHKSHPDLYSGFQMSAYSFENKKSIPVRFLSFHFAVGKMKNAIAMGNRN